MKKFSNLKRILSFTLGVLMLFNIIVFSPITTTDVEAAAAVEGTDYVVITAAQLNSAGAATTANTDFEITYTGSAISFKAPAYNADPKAWLDFSSFNISTSTFKYIVFTGKVIQKVDGAVSELFYVTDSFAINGYYTGKFCCEASSKYMSFVMSLSSVAYDTGDYAKCRFDVFSSVNANDEYQLESVMFVDDYNLAQALAWQRSSSLNGDTSNAPVFRGPGLANFMDTYNDVNTNFGNNSVNRYNYTTYDIAEDAIKIHDNKNTNDAAVQTDPGVNFNFAGVSSLITDFNTANYKYMVITYKADLLVERAAGYTTLQPFMMTSTYPNAGNAAQPYFRVFSDGEYHSIIVDLANEAKWTGDITTVRLDYLGEVYVGESFYIDSIGFYKVGTENSSLREAAAVAARDNVLDRAYADPGRSYGVDNGQFHASYDMLNYIGEYRSGNTSHSYLYDQQEDAVKVTANREVNDPSIQFMFPSSASFMVTSEYDYATLTYMIPESQKYAKGKLYFASSDTNYYAEGRSVTFNLIADGEYHSYIIDFSTFGWGGNVTKIRFDYADAMAGGGSAVAAEGDYIYIDSFCLYKTEAEAQKKAWEIYQERTYEEGVFIASPETMPMFKDTTAYSTSESKYVSDAIEVTFDEAEDAAKITVAKEATDAQVNFRFTQLTDSNGNSLAPLSTSKYKYIVVTYKANVQDFNTTGVMALYGYTALTSNNASGSLTKSHPGKNDANEYHALVFTFDGAPLWADTTTVGFRFDYSNNAHVGDEMYVDSIIYCETLDEAYQTAWDRTWYRNHERAADGSVTTTDGVLDHWEQQYLISVDSGNAKRGATSGDAVYSEYADNLTINGSTVTTEGGVKATGNQTLTYNISDLGLTADEHKFIIITYKLKEGSYATKSTAEYYASNPKMLDTAIRDKVSNVVCNITLNADGLEPGQVVSFTQQVFGDTDIDLVDGNEFHALRIDLAVPTYTWWTGNINGFTIQFDDLYSNDDSNLEVYIESVVFAGNSENNSGLQACNKVNAINGISEKTTINGSPAYLFYATPEMQYLFYDRHMCEVGYDEAHMAVKISMCNYCETYMKLGYHISGGTLENPWHTCTAPYFNADGTSDYAEIGCFDPQTYFALTENVAFATCDYLVVSYMTPTTDDGLAGLYKDNPVPKGEGDRVGSASVFESSVGIGIYPVVIAGGANPEYVKNFDIYDQGTYYSAYIDLKTYNDQTGIVVPATGLSGIRIDPFQTTFVKPGAEVYISTVALALSETNADDLSEQQLDRFYPYNFSMSYSAGEGAGDPTLKDLPATSSESRTRKNSFSFNVDHAIPTRANYMFVAWKDGSGNVTPAGTPIVLTSPKTLEEALVNPAAAAVSTALTAQWEEKVATLTYKIVGPDGVVGCGALSGTGLSGADLTASGSQLVKVLNGSPSNVTITPGDSFMFVGWYLDEACTVLVTNQAVLTTDMMATNKTTNLDSTSISSYPTVWGDITYYAKVEYAHADLTIFIEKDEELEDDQKFIVTVSEDGIHNSIDFTSITVVPTEVVTVDGTDYYKIVIKQLYGGTYTVTLDNWNWRYGYQGTLDGVATSQVFIHDSAREYIFKYNGVSNGSWLNGCGYNDGSN